MFTSDFEPTLADRLGDLVARVRIALDMAAAKHNTARQVLRATDYDDPAWSAANAARKAAGQIHAELNAALNSLIKAFAAETRTTQDL